jgi:hypothetical protein
MVSPWHVKAFQALQPDPLSHILQWPSGLRREALGTCIDDEAAADNEVLRNPSTIVGVTSTSTARYKAYLPP